MTARRATAKRTTSRRHRRLHRRVLHHAGSKGVWCGVVPSIVRREWLNALQQNWHKRVSDDDVRRSPWSATHCTWTAMLCCLVSVLPSCSDCVHAFVAGFTNARVCVYVCTLPPPPLSSSLLLSPPPPQATSLFGARLSEKRHVELHSPWLRWLPKALAILADRGFRNCQRFYANFNRCVAHAARSVCSECGCGIVFLSVFVRMTTASAIAWSCGRFRCQTHYPGCDEVGHVAPAESGLTKFFLLGVLRPKPTSDTMNQISAGTRTLLASSLEDTFEFSAGQRCCMSHGCLLRP